MISIAQDSLRKHHDDYGKTTANSNGITRITCFFLAAAVYSVISLLIIQYRVDITKVKELGGDASYYYADTQGAFADVLDFDCTITKKGESTILCPLGINTSIKLGENLKSWYSKLFLRAQSPSKSSRGKVQEDESPSPPSQVIANKDLFSKCANLPLPFNTSQSNECSPRFIILASHATSGNGIFRILLNNITGAQIGLCHYDENRGVPVFNLVMNGENRQDENTKLEPLYGVQHGEIRNVQKSKGNNLQVFGRLDDPRPLPFLGSPVLFKSHISQSTSKERRLEMTTLLQKALLNDKLHGVMILARNPGDQLLRNTYRWKYTNSRTVAPDLRKMKFQGKNGDNSTLVRHGNIHFNRNDNPCTGEECFYEKAKQLCGSLERQAKQSFIPFHSFWRMIDLGDIPRTVVHYERFSMVDGGEGSIRHVMSFFDRVSSGLDHSVLLEDERIEKMKEIIREPKFEHGTLAANICGKDATRRLHEVTKVYTEALGYVFDYESATWSLNETVFH